MATTYVGKNAPIRGPYLKHAFAKYVLKGEDAWLQQRDVTTASPLGKGACLDIFGVFDGHGGKQSAMYASKNMMPAVLKELSKATQEEAPGIDIHGKHAHASLRAEGSAQEQLEQCDEVRAEDRALWAAQDVLVGALPHALSEAFQTVEQDFLQSTKVSGTTATVVAINGWEAVIANVGDSCAYMDTGVEVVLVSGNHRLDDNKAERQRLTELGRELSSSAVEGRPVGPLRVWPGGLAMSRTLGDHEAGSAVTSEPEVRQVTLPLNGARIVIASDGLWDAVNPKTAMHHIRSMPASKAATDLMQMASKAKGQRDDITVIVVDALPAEDMRLPPSLQQRKSSATMIARSAGSGSLSSSELLEAMSGNLTDQVTVLKPLEVAHHDALWRAAVWERRLVAVQTTYGVLLPLDVVHSCSDMSTTLMLSDMRFSSSLGSGSLELASEIQAEADSDAQPLLFGSFEEEEEQQDAEDEWETVPAKSRGRKHAAEGSAASSPNNCPHGKLAKAEAASSEDEAAPPRDAFQAAQQQLGPAEGAPHPDAGGGQAPRGRGRGRGQRRGRQGPAYYRGGRRQQDEGHRERSMPAGDGPANPQAARQQGGQRQIRRARPHTYPAQGQHGQQQPPTAPAEGAGHMNGSVHGMGMHGAEQHAAHGRHQGFPTQEAIMGGEGPGGHHAINGRAGPRRGGRGGHRGRRGGPFMHGRVGPPPADGPEHAPEVREHGPRRGRAGRGYPVRRGGPPGATIVHQQAAVPVAANA